MSHPSSRNPIPEALAGIRDLYTGNLATHGLTSKSVGWKDEASQLLRFDRLARVIDDADGDAGGFAVNDWGCGYGAMFRYLDQRFGGRMRGYTGYDISPEMLAAAAAAIPSPRVRLVLGADATEEADYSFVSGTFNVKLEAADADWDRYVKEQLVRLYARSRRGLAFNLLTSHVDWRQDNLFYADPGEFLNFCKRSLSRYTTLIDDSSLYEWTMLVHREPRG
jgi:SAM-dependent methyltransferase